MGSVGARGRDGEMVSHVTLSFFEFRLLVKFFFRWFMLDKWMPYGLSIITPQGDQGPDGTRGRDGEKGLPVRLLQISHLLIVAVFCFSTEF